MGCGKNIHQKKIKIKRVLEVVLSQWQIAQVSNVSQKRIFGVSKALKQDLSLSNSVEQDRKNNTTVSVRDESR